MTSKQLFLLDKDLSSALAAVVNQHWFGKCLLYVRGSMMEGNFGAEALRGAKEFERLLLTMTDPDYKAPEPLTSGLRHSIDDPKNELIPKTKTA